jgi:hypothetical protein
LLSWFSGFPYTRTQRTDQIKCCFSSSSQRVPVSLVLAWRGPAVRFGAFGRDTIQCRVAGRRGCLTFQAKMLAKSRLLTRYLLACWLLTLRAHNISRDFNCETFVVRLCCVVHHGRWCLWLCCRESFSCRNFASMKKIIEIGRPAPFLTKMVKQSKNRLRHSSDSWYKLNFKTWKIVRTSVIDIFTEKTRRMELKYKV